MHWHSLAKTAWGRAARFSCQPLVDGLHSPVIKRFRHKGLEVLFSTGSTKGVDAALADKLRRMLARLNDGPLPEAMTLPGYKLHQLKGARAGSWAAWVIGNTRLTFDIEGEDATNVNLEDYH
jgi:toxin HigB-1